MKTKRAVAKQYFYIEKFCSEGLHHCNFFSKTKHSFGLDRILSRQTPRQRERESEDVMVFVIILVYIHMLCEYLWDTRWKSDYLFSGEVTGSTQEERTCKNTGSYSFFSANRKVQRRKESPMKAKQPGLMGGGKFSKSLYEL